MITDFYNLILRWRIYIFDKQIKEKKNQTEPA